MQENEDVLDWDFCLENPPLKPARVVEVIFEKGRMVVTYFGHLLETYKGIEIFADFDEDDDGTCCCYVVLNQEGEKKSGFEISSRRILSTKYDSEEETIDTEEEWMKLHCIARHWIDLQSTNWHEMWATIEIDKE